MSTPDQQVARALARANDAVQERPDTPEARARTVAALELAIARAATKPEPKQRWPLALAAALALVLGAGLFWGLRPAAVARVVASEGAPLGVGRGFADGTLVESGAGTLTLELPRKVTLRLSVNTAVQPREEGTRVLVRHGEVAAEVTGLEQPFVLEAGDTLVATRGARLRVKPAQGCDGRAHVEVLEGRAVIDGALELEAGQQWPSCPSAVLPGGVDAPRAEAPGVPPQPVPEPTAPPKALGMDDAARPVKRVQKPEAAAQDDRLARQNELYLQAVTLQRAGEVEAAVRKLDVILADPGSPLAEAALTHKMKWLAEVDRPRARVAAKQYLERFPMGFGRADAETLVLEKP